MKGWSNEKKSSTTVVTTMECLVERFCQMVHWRCFYDGEEAKVPESHVQALFENDDIVNGLAWPSRGLNTQANLRMEDPRRNPRRFGKDRLLPTGIEFHGQTLGDWPPIVKWSSKEEHRLDGEHKPPPPPYRPGSSNSRPGRNSSRGDYRK